MDAYNDYAYHIVDEYDLSGIRQHLKLWHALAVVERLNCERPSILDIGCGYAEVRKVLSRSDVAFDYVGVDIVARASGVRVANLVHESLLDVAHGEYDVVFMLDFLQNVDKETGIKVIGEAASLLRLHGNMVISTRNGAFEADTDAAHHVYRWDVHELVEKLNGAGIVVEDIFGMNMGRDEKEFMGMNIGQFEDSCHDALYTFRQFLPQRVARSLLGIEDWPRCKFVIIDARRV